MEALEGEGATGVELVCGDFGDLALADDFTRQLAEMKPPCAAPPPLLAPPSQSHITVAPTVAPTLVLARAMALSLALSLHQVRGQRHLHALRPLHEQVLPARLLACTHHTTRVVWLVEANRLDHCAHVPWGGIRVV